MGGISKHTIGGGYRIYRRLGGSPCSGRLFAIFFNRNVAPLWRENDDLGKSVKASRDITHYASLPDLRLDVAFFKPFPLKNHYSSVLTIN